MFLNRPSLTRAHLERLNGLLRAIIPSNPFYTSKLEKAGLAPVVSSLEEFSERFPFTTKVELTEDQQVHPPYGSNLTFALERYTRFHQTSGTSGAPLRWLDTPESWDWLVRHWEAVFRAAGVGSQDRVLCAFSFGPFIGFWMAFEAATRLGCLTLPGGGLGSTARLRLILDNQVTVLCSTPTYAIRLAEVAASEDLDLSRSTVRVILVAGEPGGSLPSVRQRLEQLWPGARVFDHHGMTEVGPVTHECPERPCVLHVMESGYLPEIVQPETGLRVPPGETGELVLTTLGRTGSPLIRYRTGDLVKAGPAVPCACGRSDLALEGGILGRADDMVVVRGVNVYPGAVEEIIRSCGGVVEYQVCVQTERALPELHLRVEPAPDYPNPVSLAERIGKAFQTHLALRVPVTCVAPGTLPRFELKARRWQHT
jgi:phenylacetate-CoA ligase